jgi:hypothetical protein
MSAFGGKAAVNLGCVGRPLDVNPKNWIVLSWNFPFMIPGEGEGEFHEEIEVH